MEGISRISFEFCLIVPKNFAGHSFSVPRISGIEIFYAREVISGSLSKFFCLTVRKFFVRQFFCVVFQIIFVSGKVFG